MTPRGLDSDYTSEEEGSGTIGLFFFACLLGVVMSSSKQPIFYLPIERLWWEQLWAAWSCSEPLWAGRQKKRPNIE